VNPLPLWPRWPAIRRQVTSAAHLLLFLDYDGTLVPLADHPSKAHIPLETKRLLQQLARQPNVYVTLVSGRSLSDLKRLVRLEDLCYIGNHGLELEVATLHYVNPVARAKRALFKQISRQLQQALVVVPGAWLEDKRLTLSVHYRSVPAKDRIRVRNIFYQIVRPHQENRQVRVTAGKCVFELRPPVRWTKGTMLNWVWIRHVAAARGATVLPVCVGDDATDEDAFEALKDHGVTIAVGPSTPLTQARYYVETPVEVHRLLQLILGARIRRSRTPHGASGI